MYNNYTTTASATHILNIGDDVTFQTHTLSNTTVTQTYESRTLVMLVLLEVQGGSNMTGTIFV
jgi:hypothetical protein